MRRTKVVQVITKLDVGGAQETVLLACRSLPRERFDVSVIAGAETGAGGGEMQTEVEAAAPLILEPALRREIRPFADIVAVVRLTRRWRRDRPDVVHTHSSKAGVVGRVAAVMAGVSVRVHTVHGWSFRDHQHWVIARAFSLIERVLARWTTAIVVVSQRDRDLGLAIGIGRREQYHVIRSGIDIERFHRPGHRPHRSRIITVTRLASPKDLFTLLRALVLLPSEYDLVVVGEGPDLEDCVRETERLGLVARVTFLGPRRDIPSLLADADVFVLSTRSEGVPRAVLEAMAADLPVVVSDVGGVREAVETGRSGLLVPPADPVALADALRRIVSDPTLADEMRREARLAVERFSSSETVDELTRLYERLVSS